MHPLLTACLVVSAILAVIIVLLLGTCVFILTQVSRENVRPPVIQGRPASSAPPAQKP